MRSDDHAMIPASCELLCESAQRRSNVENILVRLNQVPHQGRLRLYLDFRWQVENSAAQKLSSKVGEPELLDITSQDISGHLTTCSKCLLRPDSTTKHDGQI